MLYIKKKIWYLYIKKEAWTDHFHINMIKPFTDIILGN